MKKLYAVITCCLFYLALSISSQAQCSCSAGAMPDSIVHTNQVTASNSPFITIPFPKFDPAIGTLTCLTYKDTLSAVSTTKVRNKDSADQGYYFRLTTTNTISGPGLSINDYNDKFYGPDSLKGYGKGLDSITYGPDTTFNNVPHSVTKTSGLAPYLGTGNVNINYSISGGLISLSGGLNFEQNLSTTRWGKFKLTYYYCPSSVLSSNIRNFSTLIKDKSITLIWSVVSQAKNHTYEIEFSTDGKQFHDAGGKSILTPVAGSATKYEHQYNLDQMAGGGIYFRIRETDANGKITYSEVRYVKLDRNGEMSYSTYPNPTVNSINIQFDKLIKGDIEVELVNAIGQVVFHKGYRLDLSNIIKVEWPMPLKPGMYYLKTTESKKQKQSITKLLIR